MAKIRQVRSDKSLTTKDLGDFFERVALIWLRHDSLQQQEYSRVWPYAEWQREYRQENSQNSRFPKTDAGIDLVAELREHPGKFCAVQCKFFQPGSQVTKQAMDSFLSASAADPFTRRMLVTSSEVPIQKKSDPTLAEKPFHDIRLEHLLASDIDWNSFDGDCAAKKPPAVIRPHQKEALKAAEKHFFPRPGSDIPDRAQIIMPCGTGKTLTSLRIAESFARKTWKTDPKKTHFTVLYLVPSLALLSQVVRAWKSDAIQDFHALAVCSDKTTGRTRTIGDSLKIQTRDLEFPATTDPEELCTREFIEEGMTVVFATYHSAEILERAQKGKNPFPEFDLVICDEAHRTTGKGEFTRIHDNSKIRTRCRIYMTATPKVYSASVKEDAKRKESALSSMDDGSVFGPKIHELSFNEAVRRDLLCDYKVVVLTIDERETVAVKQWIARQNPDRGDVIPGKLNQMIGIQSVMERDGIPHEEPIRRALAFCTNIKMSKDFEVSLPEITLAWNAYRKEKFGLENPNPLEILVRHVDGSQSSAERHRSLRWLEEFPQERDREDCRILTNVRCLGEGVDVPSLDAISFVNTKESQTDIIQAVGRVMRKAPGKKMGYVVLPVIVKPGWDAETTLRDHSEFKTVWKVLNALRSHDRRMDVVINQLDLESGNKSTREKIIHWTITGNRKSEDEGEQESLFKSGFLPLPLQAKIVENCGTRGFWKNWAQGTAEIARKHILAIKEIVGRENTPERKHFLKFLKEVREDLNPEITEGQAVEVIAQHIITAPIFGAIFRDGKQDFTQRNSISLSLDSFLGKVRPGGIEAERESLKHFYEDVALRAKAAESLAAKQTLIKQIYGDFFKHAFPMTVAKFGIFYTPVPVVDFMIRSVEHILKTRFGTDLSGKGVDILEPFGGTGTFITRLLQSGQLGTGRDMETKYRERLHLNEVILLAYYIACVNIEAVFHEESGSQEYIPFEGVVYTDTFHLHEKRDATLFDQGLEENTGRRRRQKDRPIHVIISNPPYSSGQRDANDNAPNTDYPYLNERIRQTYAAETATSTKMSLYDSYIQAFRWASDRIEEKNHGEGVIAYITNAGWLTTKAGAGVRARFKKEFDEIIVLGLRGNLRAGLISSRPKAEGENIFGIMTPVAITLLVKKQGNRYKREGKILYADVPECLSKEEKLEFLNIAGDISSKVIKFREIEPDDENNWLLKFDSRFRKLPSMNTAWKGKDPIDPVFTLDTSGFKSGRRYWNLNFNKERLETHVKKSIRFYNMERNRIHSEVGAQQKSVNQIVRLVTRDETKIKWDDSLINGVFTNKEIQFNPETIRTQHTRPFTRAFSYSCPDFNARLYKIPQVFPDDCRRNLAICIGHPNKDKEFSCLMTAEMPDLNLLGGAKNFPLWRYYPERFGTEKPEPVSGSEGLDQVGFALPEPSPENASSLFGELDTPKDLPEREYAISKETLKLWRKAYPEETITEKDLFFHIYGLLHSPDYREAFETDLKLQYPRIPVLSRYEDFRAFADAGQELSDLHTGYESVDLWEAVLETNVAAPKDLEALYRVEKMLPVKFENGEKDLTQVRYNSHITIQRIPTRAWEYRVNGAPALKWVMSQQQCKRDKETGILNDCNDWAVKHMKNPRYPLELFLRMIMVSMKTLEIVEHLPKMEIWEA